jgi:radical SAM superfamily enzyme YgiQ (UPF0313 family)
MKKILLNCLPPSDIYKPAASLSILKSFMVVNGYETEIKYWNFLFSDIFNYSVTEDTEVRILPFIYILNEKENNFLGNQRLTYLMREIQPSFIELDKNYYSTFLEETKLQFLTKIEEELLKINFDEVLLFGISSKFHQWIPGIIISEIIKEKNPSVKIVVGGFGSKEAAVEAVNVCKYFDFAIWGEGEYPLLELSKQLDEGTNEFDNVPRLIYRKYDQIQKSLKISSMYLDFENYIFPDYSDFFKSFPENENKNQISLPINSMRACSWGKCKFCDFNHGYKYRERTPESIVNEIENNYESYGVCSFLFVDNEICGKNNRLEKLLELLIDSRYKRDSSYKFWAEMIPSSSYDSKLIKKLAISGFNRIFLGSDAVSDTLLKKMNKSNNVSANIFFIKQALKNGITLMVNVIMGIHGETEDDVYESINNLHYLRFFFNFKDVEFFHQYGPLVITTMTKYYSEITKDEIKEYDNNTLTYLLPGRFSNKDDNRFHLFRWGKSVLNNSRTWDIFKNIEYHYIKKKYSYKVFEDRNIYYYKEYCNNEEINEIVFNEPEYWDTLVATNNIILTKENLLKELNKKYPSLKVERLETILQELKDSYLIYCNSELSNIVSVIDVEGKGN